jgi:hypothetical protein
LRKLQPEDPNESEEQDQQSPADPQLATKSQDLCLQVGLLSIKDIQGHDIAEFSVLPVVACRLRDAAVLGDSDITGAEDELTQSRILDLVAP